MNTIHEMLLPDLIDQKIADRRADAVAWRRAREATESVRPGRTWSLTAVLHLPGFRSDRAAKAV